MNSNLKFIFLLKQTWKHIQQWSLFFIIILLLLFYLFNVVLVSQNPVVAIALLPRRLFFRSTIMKAWHRLWASWRKNTQDWQLTGSQIMVHILPFVSTLLITATQEQSWTITTTLFHLQCRTAARSWPGLNIGTSHLMRWRYFILTHPAKCKITQTIIFITIKSESEAMESLI